MQARIFDPTVAQTICTDYLDPLKCIFEHLISSDAYRESLRDELIRNHLDHLRAEKDMPAADGSMRTRAPPNPPGLGHQAFGVKGVKASSQSRDSHASSGNDCDNSLSTPTQHACELSIMQAGGLSQTEYPHTNQIDENALHNEPFWTRHERPSKPSNDRRVPPSSLSLEISTLPTGAHAERRLHVGQRDLQRDFGPIGAGAPSVRSKKSTADGTSSMHAAHHLTNGLQRFIRDSSPSADRRVINQAQAGSSMPFLSHPKKDEDTSLTKSSSSAFQEAVREYVLRNKESIFKGLDRENKSVENTVERNEALSSPSAESNKGLKKSTADDLAAEVEDDRAQDLLRPSTSVMSDYEGATNARATSTWASVAAMPARSGPNSLTPTIMLSDQSDARSTVQDRAKGVKMAFETQAEQQRVVWLTHLPGTFTLR